MRLHLVSPRRPRSGVLTMTTKSDGGPLLGFGGGVGAPVDTEVVEGVLDIGFWLGVGVGPGEDCGCRSLGSLLMAPAAPAPPEPASQRPPPSRRWSAGTCPRPSG